jgi:hypothetical protein
MEENIENLANIYKVQISDFASQQILQKIWSMAQEFPNDQDLGRKIRNLLNEITEFKKEEARKNSLIQLKTIINESKGSS